MRLLLAAVVKRCAATKFRYQSAAFIFILAFIQLYAVSSAEAQTHRYVKPGATGTGTGSWANASGDLQAVINASAPGDEVWVMKGQYQPAAGTSFVMAKAVKIYGGFDGTENGIYDRPIPSTSPAAKDSSRLVGNGNSVIINDNNGLDGSAILDCFFITGGRAKQGGGMYSRNASPVISNCIFSGNTATDNTAPSGGGGMYITGGAPSVRYCTFSFNSVGSNNEVYGGGIYMEASQAGFSHCKFTGNSFSRGTTKTGPGMYINTGAPRFVNCSVMGNGTGTGAVSVKDASPFFTNCTIAFNSLGITTIGVPPAAPVTTSVNFTNCIIWGNSNNIIEQGHSNFTFANCIVQQGYPGANVLTTDPRFKNAPPFQTQSATADLRLQSSSPAIDAGNITAVPANEMTDLDGIIRFINGVVDIGAYEYLPEATLYSVYGGDHQSTVNVSTAATAVFLEQNNLIAALTSDGTNKSVTGNTTAKVWVEPALALLFNNQVYLRRHYEIIPPDSNATGIVNLYIRQEEFDDYNLVIHGKGNPLSLPNTDGDAEGYKSNLVIIAYKQGSSDGSGKIGNYTHGFTRIHPADSNFHWAGSYWIVSFQAKGFGGFFVQAGQAIPAVQWISANAGINGQHHAQLNWSVTEQQVTAYTVERSQDSLHFTTAGILSSSGNGQHSYQFTDTATYQSPAYYRIWATYTDGSTSVSDVLRLANDGSQLPGTRRYVKAGGTGTGTGSWANAAGDLQATVNVSSAGDEVWVMKGLYQAQSGTYFYMKKGVKIYGSFAGTETDLASRSIGKTSADSSILMANINNNVIRLINPDMDSAHGLDSTAVLDGFYITTRPDNQVGGGVSISYSSPIISHCIFANLNSVWDSTNSGVSWPVFISGGAPLIRDCVFKGIRQTPTSIGSGEAVMIEYSQAKFSRCIFSGNTVEFPSNSSYTGIIYINSCNPSFSNCSFTGNKSSLGAIYNVTSSPVFTNCTIASNSVGVFNIGMQYGPDTTGPVFINSIIWGNGVNIKDIGFAKASFTNCIAEGGYAGANTLNEDPLFKSPVAYQSSPTTAGDFSLQPSSPAIGAGFTAAVPADEITDLAGNPRIDNGVVDMGAYEYQGDTSAMKLPSGHREATMHVASTGTSTFLGSDHALIATITGDGSATAVSDSVTAKVWKESAIPFFNSQPYVARHYEITPQNSNASAMITLYFDQQDFTDYNNAAVAGPKLPMNPADAENYKANLIIRKYSLTSSDGSGLMGTYQNGHVDINPEDFNIRWNGSYWLVTFPVTSFSGFFVQAAQNALPVKWISTKVQLNNAGHAEVSWTVMEQLVANYSIEKSSDGQHFSTAGALASLGDGEHSYQFTDPAPLNGTVYYRIRQIDKDGAASISGILTLRNSTTNAVCSVYPNPVNANTVVSISVAQPEKISFELTDAKGAVLQKGSAQLTAGNNRIPVTIINRAAGVYYLIIKGSTINQQIKIVKQE